MTRPPRLYDSEEAARELGVPASFIYTLKSRRQVIPDGFITGRGRGGQVPLYALATLRPHAEAYLARAARRHRRHAEQGQS